MQNDAVDMALLPVENSCGGTIHDVYLLLPKYGLHIVGEYSLKVNHCLLAPRGTQLTDIKYALSHKQVRSLTLFRRSHMRQACGIRHSLNVRNT